MKTFHFVSLGCPKNRVDTEVAAARLLAAGLVPARDERSADLLVVNTCSFIRDARTESEDALRAVARIKKLRPKVRVVAMGCLCQQDPDRVAQLVPGVDLVLGTGCVDRIDTVLERSGPRVLVGPGSFLPRYETPRILSQSPSFAYLKIGDGCDRKCAFCAIPAIKGPAVSRPIPLLVAEARQLAGLGVRELVLVAQDTTQFGKPDDGALLRLLDALEAIDSIAWIRLMYAYPDRISRALLRRLAEGGKVLPYLDMPIQHIDDRILKAMRRGTSASSIRGAVQTARALCPRITLRTTVITGFPGEDDKAFDALLRFIEEARFQHLGAFAFRPEAGTVAATMDGQVPARERTRRRNAVMRLQKRISTEINRSWIGRTLNVLVDSDGAMGGPPTARTAFQAPEVDGVVYLDRTEAVAGRFLQVRITRSTAYDLVGTNQPADEFAAVPGADE